MIRKQRKKHLFLWIVISVCLPVLIVGSILGIRPQLLTDNTIPQNSSLISDTSIWEDDYVVISRKANTQYELDILIKQPLKYPSVLAYGISAQGGETLLGALGEKGGYRFMVNEEITSIRLYDGIKKQAILNIDL